VAIATLGLFLAAFGRSKSYPESDKALDIWGYFTFAAESCVFQLCGVGSGTNIFQKFSISDFYENQIYFKVILLYFFVFACRLFALFIFYPVLMTRGYGMNSNELVVYAFASVRGATTLSFMFLLSTNPLITFQEAQILIFYISGVSILSLIFNQYICKFLINFL
jgi:hypothetical protein